MAAAMAAVSTFLQREEEAYRAEMAAAMATPKSMPAPMPAAGPWCQGGRQEMMQLRNLMQMKAFHRF